MKDYLNQLKVRCRWQKSDKKIAKNYVVIVKDDILHPAVWPIGRIVRIYPALDGELRVVDWLKGAEVIVSFRTLMDNIVDLCRYVPVIIGFINLFTNIMKVERFTWGIKTIMYTSMYLSLKLIR